MGLEIERKFLLKPGVPLPDSDRVQHLRQCYLNQDTNVSIRLRVVDNETAYLTIKNVVDGQLAVRAEYEYQIPVEDALQMEQFAFGTPIVKNRHIIMEGDLRWEVDFFEEENEGLILVEVELQDLATPIAIPEWVGKEVSEDPRYLNNQLAMNPYKYWNTKP